MQHCTRIMLCLLIARKDYILFYSKKKADQLINHPMLRVLAPQPGFRRACPALYSCAGGLPLGPSGLGGPRYGLGTARYCRGPSHFRSHHGLCRWICRWAALPWGLHGLSLPSWSWRLARRSSRPPPHCPCTMPACSWSGPWYNGPPLFYETRFLCR